MKTVIISGYSCIFDDDTNTSELYVHVTQSGYKSVRYGHGKYAGKVFSRIVLNVPDNLIAEHKSGNSLDCRKDNLRLATKAQNLYNTNGNRNKRSGLPKGVYMNRDSFIAKISVHSTQYHLGTFNTVEEAIAAHKKAADKLHGDFAVHNR